MGPSGRIAYIGLLGQVNAGLIQELYLGRAPRTKDTLPDFLKWRRVTRPPLVFRGLTGSQRTPRFWSVTNSPLSIECNAKHNTNGDGIYHRTKSLVKINARLLVKALSNKVSFIPCNRVVGILFDVKHPFVAHYILPRSWGN